MNAFGKGARRVSLRHVAALMAIAVAMIALPTIALAGTSGAQLKVRNCGDVQSNVAVTTAGGVSCKAAKKIANTWLKQKKQTTGFKCHKKKTNAGSGFQGVCTKGKQRVFIIPE
jgi:hypothetical protein